MKIVSSKNKSKVLAWAKRNERECLWRDENGFWHAATLPKHSPTPWELTGVKGVELPWPIGDHVGRQLAWLRENCGMTQAQVAKKMTK